VTPFAYWEKAIQQAKAEWTDIYKIRMAIGPKNNGKSEGEWD